MQHGAGQALLQPLAKGSNLHHLHPVRGRSGAGGHALQQRRSQLGRQRDSVGGWCLGLRRRQQRGREKPQEGTAGEGSFQSGASVGGVRK
ncbi:hypothetical protein GCM10027048_31240 [Hymenobacter coalescens]